MVLLLAVASGRGNKKAPSIAGGALGCFGVFLAFAPTATARPAISGRGGGAGEAALNEIHGSIMLGRARGCQRRCHSFLKGLPPHCHYWAESACCAWICSACAIGLKS